MEDKNNEKVINTNDGGIIKSNISIFLKIIITFFILIIINILVSLTQDTSKKQTIIKKSSIVQFIGLFVGACYTVYYNVKNNHLPGLDDVYSIQMTTKFNIMLSFVLIILYIILATLSWASIYYFIINIIYTLIKSSYVRVVNSFNLIPDTDKSIFFTNQYSISTYNTFTKELNEKELLYKAYTVIRYLLSIVTACVLIFIIITFPYVYFDEDKLNVREQFLANWARKYGLSVLIIIFCLDIVSKIKIFSFLNSFDCIVQIFNYIFLKKLNMIKHFTDINIGKLFHVFKPCEENAYHIYIFFIIIAIIMLVSLFIPVVKTDILGREIIKNEKKDINKDIIPSIFANFENITPKKAFDISLIFIIIIMIFVYIYVFFTRYF